MRGSASAVEFMITRFINFFIIRPNRWYDNLPEFRRFLVFIIPLVFGNVIFGLLGGAWHVSWWVFVAAILLPWRMAYFAMPNTDNDKTDDNQ